MPLSDRSTMIQIGGAAVWAVVVAVVVIGTSVGVVLAGRMTPAVRGTMDGDDETSDDETVVTCEYCGDEFDSTAGRDGHLRWCESYDRGNGTGAADGSSADGSTAGPAGDGGGDRPTGAGEGTTVTAMGGDRSPERVDVSAAGNAVGGSGANGEVGSDERPDSRGPTVASDDTDDTESNGKRAAGTADSGTRDGSDGGGEASPPPTAGMIPVGDVIDTVRDSGFGIVRPSVDGSTDRDQPALPRSTLAAARRRIDDDAGRAVRVAYVSVRDEIVERRGDELPDHETPREFCDACRATFDDDEWLDALERLISLYERACYGNDDRMDRAVVVDVLDRLVDGNGSERGNAHEPSRGT
ncbi:MAG: DUF4129 domain-containing protein [Haloplanus sp.]